MKSILKEGISNLNAVSVGSHRGYLRKRVVAPYRGLFALDPKRRIIIKIMQEAVVVVVG